MVAALDSFWWWLLAAAVGGLIGAFLREAGTIFITDPILRKRRLKEDDFQRNQTALQNLIGPLNETFDLISDAMDKLRSAEDKVAPGTFRLSEKLAEIDRVWNQVSGNVSDRRVWEAYRRASPSGLIRLWDEAVQNATMIKEFETLAVLIHNALADFRRELARYLPGLMPDDLPTT